MIGSPRGQRVGTEIYTELEQRARAKGAQTLGLSATQNAVPFYESHGYERMREYTHEFSSHEETGVTGTVIDDVSSGGTNQVAHA
ncbi:GNAT family N-acetyltransferase [Haladaptatus sp. DFWS20]|uniref:GNAT family N-acetyltransferase n=1 Tax=Haladaptatus sp. DFWS20 TaxID=3403467 RepID=UPI003EBC1539